MRSGLERFSRPAFGFHVQAQPFFDNVLLHAYQALSLLCKNKKSRRCRASRSKKRGVERGTCKKMGEVRSAAGELAVPQLKDMPITSDPDPRKRRAMEATTVVASSSQMESFRAVAETPTQQNSMAGGSRMNVEEEERGESRSSKAQNIRQRPKHQWRRVWMTEEKRR